MAISKRLRFEVLKRDQFRCHYCHNAEALITVDHVNPKTLGGTDEPSNLVACCDDCNSGKTSTLPGGALIDGPAGDLTRWTRAIRRAAHVAFEHEVEKEAYRGNFKAEWDRWRFNADGSTVPLPEDWDRTLDEFYAADLPNWVWSRIVAQSMAQAVHGNRFQHARQLAWQWTRELRKSAQLSLSHAEEVVELAVDHWVVAYERNAQGEAGDELRAQVRERGAKYFADGVSPEALLHAASAGGACDDVCFRAFERHDPETVARIREAVRVWRRRYSFRRFEAGRDDTDPDIVALDSFELEVGIAIDIGVDQASILAAAVGAGDDVTAELSAYLPELAEHYEEFAEQFTSAAEGGTA